MIEKHSKKNGAVEIDNNKLKISHPEGFLIIEELQLPNKKRMNASDLLNGFKFKKGSKVL